MHISVIGSGYVGTPAAAVFADLGHEVVTIDIDETVVEAINNGEPPLPEPGLDELIGKHGGDRLTGTTSYDVVAESDVIFLVLPTPSNEDGSIDLGPLEDSAERVGEAIADSEKDHLIVVKSTVIPGTTEDIVVPALEETSGKKAGEGFDVAMNPEFQREGSAVADFQRPDKIVLGVQDGDPGERALDRLNEVYAPLLAEHEAAVVETGIREAEMIKYANNAFLANKISFINEIGNICKEYGVDSYEVADAIGLDHRIEASFLRSGVGWGGSCFPKDVDAIRAAAREIDYEPDLLDATVAVNDKQPQRLLELLDEHADVAGKRVAVLGLSFKPGTNDTRKSRAIPVIVGLIERGAKVVGYDPLAVEEMREKFPNIDYADSAAEALEGAHAALVTTDWDEFGALDDEFDSMAEPVVIDGRRIVERRDGIEYDGLTW